jgi:DNA-binding FrmR family transcriptional regulator|tara:strand:- start:19045 stop:19332 length:288 start_codon:yes stop_codon:yes gene_type:complete
MLRSTDEKRRAITRLRRIRGQAEALERAIEADTECAPLLQQIVAMRGATLGLMAQIMENYLRDTFNPDLVPASEVSSKDFDDVIAEVMKILRTYL